MMGVFERVRENVTARQAAEHYGLKVNHYGMAVCPFHDDRNPSMKLDRRYYCFGCGATGDAIDFVSKKYGITLKEAAIKIAGDFDIAYGKNRKNAMTDNKPRTVKIKPLHKRYAEFKIRFWRGITDYYHMLCEWREIYKPVDMDQEWDPRFVEALKNIARLEYIMDTFLDGDPEIQADIIIEYGRSIDEYERRVREYSAGETGGTGKDNAGNRKGDGEAA